MPRIRIAVGVAAGHAHAFTGEVEEALRQAALTKHVAAIGSFGIANADSAEEVHAFERQAALAAELGLVAVVDVPAHDGATPPQTQVRAQAKSQGACDTPAEHAPLGECSTRSAREDELAMSLLAEAGIAPERVVARVGGATPRSAQEWAAWGSYLSFDARAAADPLALCRAIDAIPADRVLVESGAPSAGVDALAGYPPRADQVVFVVDVIVSRMPAAQIAANMRCLFGK